MRKHLLSIRCNVVKYTNHYKAKNKGESVCIKVPHLSLQLFELPQKYKENVKKDLTNP